ELYFINGIAKAQIFKSKVYGFQNICLQFLKGFSFGCNKVTVYQRVGTISGILFGHCHFNLWPFHRFVVLMSACFNREVNRATLLSYFKPAVLFKKPEKYMVFHEHIGNKFITYLQTVLTKCSMSEYRYILERGSEANPVFAC